MGSLIIGVQGTRAILQDLATIEPQVKTVAIGGINALNVQRVLFQSRATTKGLDGVAVVSGIISATDPKAAAGAYLWAPDCFLVNVLQVRDIYSDTLIFFGDILSSPEQLVSLSP